MKARVENSKGIVLWFYVPVACHLVPGKDGGQELLCRSWMGAKAVKDGGWEPRSWDPLQSMRVVVK